MHCISVLTLYGGKKKSAEIDQGFPLRGRLIKSQIQFALSVCSSFGGAGHSLSVTEGVKLYQTLTSPKGATRAVRNILPLLLQGR